MIKEKTTASARVPTVMKEIVSDSEYSHRDAYMLGAGLICIGKAKEAKNMIDNNPEYERAVKEKKCQILKEEKKKLEDELEKEMKKK